MVKPPWPTLSATERARPVTVVPLSTATVVARFSAVDRPVSVGLLDGVDSGASAGEGATLFDAGFGSSPPPENAPRTMAMTTPTTSTPATIAAIDPALKRPPSPVREPARPRGPRVGGIVAEGEGEERSGIGVGTGRGGTGGAGEAGRSAVPPARAAAVRAAVAGWATGALGGSALGASVLGG